MEAGQGMLGLITFMRLQSPGPSCLGPASSLPDLLRLPAANLLCGDHLFLKPPRDPWGSSYFPARP